MFLESVFLIEAVLEVERGAGLGIFRSWSPMGDLYRVAVNECHRCLRSM